MRSNAPILGDHLTPLIAAGGLFADTQPAQNRPGLFIPKRRRLAIPLYRQLLSGQPSHRPASRSLSHLIRQLADAGVALGEHSS